MIKINFNKGASNKFNKKYGKVATKEFHEIMCNTGKLSDAAKHFGFSRAYASLLFKLLYPVTLVKFKQLRARHLYGSSVLPSYKELTNLKSILRGG